jgi:RNA polymerase sigma-70 factor (ECF subfamily)
LTLSDVARATASGLTRAFLQDAGATDETLTMDEPTFRAFYERSARPLWAYLWRATGDPHAADDLLQETYYRFLRADRPFASDAHRRHYLFRIAINLVRTRSRRPSTRAAGAESAAAVAEPAAMPADPAVRTDLSRALDRLRPRERALLWLAYAEGSSHREIAGMLGVKAASVKMLLFRARRKLAALLRHGVSRAQD